MTTEVWEKEVRPTMCLACGDKAAEIIKERDESIKRLKERERMLGQELYQCRRKLETSIQVRDLPELMMMWWVSRPDGNPRQIEEHAEAWLRRNEYIIEPLPRDTEATVGPIRDHGNPFETGIPR